MINSNFCSDYDAHTFLSESTVVVLNAQGPLNPQNTLPTMIHAQVILTITCQYPNEKDISYQPHSLYLWVDPLESSSEHVI
jgi:hypothetical protein